MKKPEIIFGGTGNAWGIPEIGCECEICKARRLPYLKNKKQNRLRTSFLYKSSSDENILIECGPDFKQQYETDYNPNKIDAVLIGHNHFDHCLSFADLRPIAKNINGEKIKIYATQPVWDRIEKLFGYMQSDTLEKHLIEPGKEESLSDNLSFTGIEMNHGQFAPGNVGYVIKDKQAKRKIAYTSDFRCAKADTSPFSKADLLIAETNWFNEPLDNKADHMSLQKLLEYIEYWQPRQTYCVHFSCRDMSKSHISIDPLKDNQGNEYPVPKTVHEWEDTLYKIIEQKSLTPIYPAHDSLRITL